MTLYRELYRPQFHFTPRANWMNDPNGLVYQDGVWHLFFQHNTEAPVWGPMTWGHAVSDDLMHWRQQEHALHPDEHGTMFSGCAVVDHDNRAGFGRGALLAFYTAAGQYAAPKRPNTQCLAFSLDNGTTWTKYANNPVVGWFEDGNRDPKVIWHAPSDHWIMALYLADDRYCLLRSSDARNWQRFQDLRLEGDSECPDFFPLTDAAGVQRWVFRGASGVYLIGRFDGKRFEAETGPLLCERGPNGYAAQTWSDTPDGRRIQISWMAGGLYPEMPFNQQLSVPMELSLVGSGSAARLARWPVAEVERIRQRTVAVAHHTLSKDAPLVADTRAKLLDVSFDVQRRAAGKLHLMLRGQPMTFDWTAGVLRFRSSGARKAHGGKTVVNLPDSERLAVRLLVDRTSVEVFLDHGLHSACYCFLPGAYVAPLVLQSGDEPQVIESFAAHELGSTWD